VLEAALPPTPRTHRKTGTNRGLFKYQRRMETVEYGSPGKPNGSIRYGDHHLDSATVSNIDADVISYTNRTTLGGGFTFTGSGVPLIRKQLLALGFVRDARPTRSTPLCSYTLTCPEHLVTHFETANWPHAMAIELRCTRWINGVRNGQTAPCMHRVHARFPTRLLRLGP
jgi:hypothetical protein